MERQSLTPSERLGAGRSLGGPSSSRRREEPRESGKSGKGPSRRQGLSNLESSSNPPLKPPRSFAVRRQETV
jgi:hypothetical protein